MANNERDPEKERLKQTVNQQNRQLRQLEQKIVRANEKIRGLQRDMDIIKAKLGYR